MYSALLQIHNIFRWIVLVLFLITLFRYFVGWFSQQNWGKLDKVLGISLTALLDIQLLTGLLLYFVYSPLTKTALQDFSIVSQNRDMQYYAVEHEVIMLIVIVFAHVGWKRTKKAKSSKLKFSNALIFFGLSYLAIMLGIPWCRVI